LIYNSFFISQFHTTGASQISKKMKTKTDQRQNLEHVLFEFPFLFWHKKGWTVCVVIIVCLNMFYDNKYVLTHHITKIAVTQLRAVPY